MTEYFAFENFSWRLELRVSAAEREALERTCLAFARACDHVRMVGRREGTVGTVRLQALCYADLRERYGLRANLAVRAVARAAAMLKNGDDRPAVGDRVDYDLRVLSIAPEKRSVSVSTLDGRLRTVRADADGGRWPADGVFKRATLLAQNGTFRLFVWGDPNGTVTFPRSR